MAANRREFLANVGRGMIVASVGCSVASQLGIISGDAWADDKPDRLRFGELDALVGMIRDTPPEKIISAACEKLQQGTTLKQLVAAGALANARAFGGEDYVGFHTLMALAPSLGMAEQLPADRRALPVLKVLYRNASRLKEVGPEHETLRPVQAVSAGEGNLRDAVHRRDYSAAEQALAATAARSAEEAYNELLPIVEEGPEVHRVVLVHRAWDMRHLTGAEHAHTLLRQSLRFCVKNEETYSRNYGVVRQLLPKIMDQYKLVDKPLGDRSADDAWIDGFQNTLFNASPEQAAEAVAAAIAEGMSPTAISDAVCLATNQLLLRDYGRTGKQTQPNKGEGSVHGDSIGVHACDSANAWRNIARVANNTNATAALVLSGWQMATDRLQRGGDFLSWQPRPYQADLEKITAKDAAELLKQLDGAIRENNQNGASALAHRYGELGHDPKAIFGLLLHYATSEDGALHHEKFFRTASEEYAAARPAFRWRQVVALARVTASGCGQPAPGYEEACKALGVGMARTA